MTSENNKTAYELIRDAYKVFPSTDEDLAKGTSTLKILVVEDRRQPVAIAPETSLTVDGIKRLAIINGVDGQVTIPLSELWEMLNQRVVLKRVRSSVAKSAYETSACNYADQLVKEIVDDLRERGREWDLPSVYGEDDITIGDPAVTALPKTLYLDNNDRLHLVCVDVNTDEEMTELVKYPALSIEDIEFLKELLDRPLDDDDNENED